MPKRIFKERRCLGLNCVKMITPKHDNDWFCPPCRKQKDKAAKNMSRIEADVQKPGE